MTARRWLMDDVCRSVIGNLFGDLVGKEIANACVTHRCINLADPHIAAPWNRVGNYLVQLCTIT